MAEPSAKAKVEEHNPLDELLTAEKAYVRTYREITSEVARQSAIVYKPSRFEHVASRKGAKRALRAAGNEFSKRMRKAFPLSERDAMIDDQLPIIHTASERMFLAGMSEATGKSQKELRKLDRAVAKYEDVPPDEFEGFDEPTEDIVIGASVRAGLHADTEKLDRRFRKENRALMADVWEEHAKNIEEKGVGELAQGIAEDAIAAALVLLLDNLVRDQTAITVRRGDNIAMNETQVAASRQHSGRQSNAGIAQYIWTSQGDESVRPRHEELDGQTFPVEGSGPDDGMHPGEPPLCRCFQTPAPFTQITRFYTGEEAELYKRVQGRRLLTAGFE